MLQRALNLVIHVPCPSNVLGRNWGLVYREGMRVAREDNEGKRHMVLRKFDFLRADGVYHGDDGGYGYVGIR